MYLRHFQLREAPFSTAPNPTYLYLSAHHQEALGHLLYGTSRHGGFVQLTGEVGTGKTTLIRTLLRRKLERVEVAMVHNPRLSEREFVAAICDEFHVEYPHTPLVALKTLVDALNAHLLNTHAAGGRSVLIIDEAQNLAPEVLEQVRLLTNLETDEDKLLRIMLIGQPELIDLLARPDLRQLASRITARYHLPPLTEAETHGYIAHRLRVAGARQPLFTAGAMAAVYQRSRGIPRLVNILCDRALLGAYAKGAHQVSDEIVHRAAAEVLGTPPPRSPLGRAARTAARGRWGWVEIGLVATVLVVAGLLAQQLLASFGDRIPALSSAIAALPPASDIMSGATHADATAGVAGQPVRAIAASVVSAPPGNAGYAAPAPPNGPTAPAAVPTNLGQVMAHAETLNVIVARLIALWAPDLRVERGAVVCSALSTADLQCYHGNGDFADLARMNRPAILHLEAGKAHSQYVLLRKLAGGNATLDTGRGLVTLPVTQLRPAWTGEFLLIWPGDIHTAMLSVGTRGSGVVWLRRQLALLDGDDLPDAPSPVFDDNLREQVMDYQRAAGLDVDGVAGAATLVSLSSVGDTDGTPTLHAAVGEPG